MLPLIPANDLPGEGEELMWPRIQGLLFISLVQTIRLFVYKIQILDIHRLIYFTRALATGIFFIKKSMHWRRYMKTWAKVDEAMKLYAPFNKSQRRVNTVISILTVMFAVDLVLISIHRMRDDMLVGNMEFNLETWNHLVRDLKYPYVYQIFHYDIFSGIILVIVQTQFLIAATYLDLFIVINSVLLTERVEKVSDKIKELSQSMIASEDQWMAVREDYNRLECLCKTVNLELGYAFLISYAGNLGGVLIQLYNTLNFEGTSIGLTYLYYSFGFVLTRILCVCFFGSNVNEAAKRSLMFLYRAPNSAYYIEIAGSIVTYELVLVQFAGDVMNDKSTSNKTNSFHVTANLVKRNPGIVYRANIGYETHLRDITSKQMFAYAIMTLIDLLYENLGLKVYRDKQYTDSWVKRQGKVHVEHTLINAHILIKNMITAPSTSQGFKSYFVDSYPATFNFTEYSPLLGVMNESADMVSWRRVRQDYTHLVDLCNYTNTQMSLSIVISFTVNLYFMVEQIFKNIQPSNGPVQKSYFVISMTLLVTRTFCVIIFSGIVLRTFFADGTIFDFSSVVQWLILLQICTRWPKFVREWCRVETRMRSYKFYGNLKRKISFITFGILAFAAVEHFMINFNSLSKCLKSTDSIQEGFEFYFTSSNFAKIFTFISS
nr:unnamed protein product [Callosobruchus analis]